ncbi:two-component sensor histidine kinase [Paenibacillus montaniterrae]|uniref:histidine kinase n=1 Tax=Paenibacillus montaniterrae TaxID=429341 RepID=A0A920CW52_9BACL|nr:HAMP domain-containing sensor histidine kinase [Paenibacillus montaniterrae]GIP18907.1 two-component sensor histidine kinase [Paenibacillus montaniterrae]
MKLRNKMFIQHSLTIIMLLIVMYVVVQYSLSKGMLEKETGTLNQYYTLHRIETMKLISDQKISVDQLFTGNYAPFIASHLSANSNFQVQLFTKDETIVGSSDKSLLLKRSDITSALKGQTATIIAQENGTRYFIYAAPFTYQGEIVGGIRYLVDLGQHDAALRETRLWFIGVALACLLISLLAGFSLSSALLKPLHDLQRALKHVAKGNFNIKIKQSSKDEIGELSQDFNHMSDALLHHIALLEYEQNKQKKFYDNMTHELKTPLTSIIGFSNLIDKLQPNDDVRESNSYIRKESTRLLHMVEQLLHISLTKQDGWNIQCKYVNLAEVAEECLQILQPTIAKSSIKLTVSKQSAIVYIDPLRTQQVIFNVIDNVLKHSACSKLQVELREDALYGIIIITDNGKGMDAEQLASLFKLNQKSSRTLSSNSYGLGMPLVKELMELQGGSINISSKPGHGTQVTLLFDKYEKKASSYQV